MLDALPKSFDGIEVRAMGWSFNRYNAMGSQSIGADLARMERCVVMLEEKARPVSKIVDNEWKHVLCVLLASKTAFVFPKKRRPQITST